MPGPDYLQFKSYMENQRNDLQHSPKGTTWKKHKYVKKEDGKYYYKESGQYSKDIVNGKVVSSKKLDDLYVPIEDYSNYSKEEIRKMMENILKENVNSRKWQKELYYKVLKGEYQSERGYSETEDKLLDLAFHYNLKRNQERVKNAVNKTKNIPVSTSKSNDTSLLSKAKDKVNELWNSGKNAIDKLIKKIKK